MSASPAERDEALAYASAALDEVRGHLERAQSATATALVHVRLLIAREHEGNDDENDHGETGENR